MKQKTAKYIFIILGAAVTVLGLCISFTSNINAGVIMTVLLGVLLLAIGIFSRHAFALPRWIRILFFAALAVFFVFSSFLMIYGHCDTADGNENAIIVLGAGVHGRTPSRALRGRLDAAIKYLEANPHTIAVVSGGQGPQEDITEAEAMEIYLTDHGIAPERIIREDSSTSTYENFVNSKALLDERFPGGWHAAFVTNDYHIFRAARVAASAGIRDITHIHYTTRPTFWLPSLLRECLAIVKYAVFGGM